MDIIWLLKRCGRVGRWVVSVQVFSLAGAFGFGRASLEARQREQGESDKQWVHLTKSEWMRAFEVLDDNNVGSMDE